MKFATAKFYRLRGYCGEFVEVLAVISDTGETAEITVAWCKHFDKGWKSLHAGNIRISARDYLNWMPYRPPGIKLNAN